MRRHSPNPFREFPCKYLYFLSRWKYLIFLNTGSTTKTAKTPSVLREGVKQILVTDRSVNGGGALNPQSATKIVFFLVREEDAECSETEKYVFWWKITKYVHLDLFYVLEYSRSFDMQIEKLFLKKLLRGEGSSELYWHIPLALSGSGNFFLILFYKEMVFPIYGLEVFGGTIKKKIVCVFLSLPTYRNIYNKCTKKI